jgi:hypothetical protein
MDVSGWEGGDYRLCEGLFGDNDIGQVGFCPLCMVTRSMTDYDMGSGGLSYTFAFGAFCKICFLDSTSSTTTERACFNGGRSVKSWRASGGNDTRGT